MGRPQMHLKPHSSESGPPQSRREKNEDQENKINIVSRQPQKRNNIGAFFIRMLRWLPHRKVHCQVLKVEYNYQ